MIYDNSFKMFLSMFPYYLPMMVVCIVGLVVAINRWRQAPEASLWAVLGFGIALFICLGMPVAQVLARSWALGDGHHSERIWVFGVLSFAGSILHAAVYAFLLVAIYTGRQKRPEPPAPAAGTTL